MTKLAFRDARRDDVAEVVDLLREDVLGETRESRDLTGYLAAFDAMEAEGGNQTIVGELGGRIVVTYQITVIAGLSLRASRRAQIESVRVHKAFRRQGIGAAMIADAEARARAAGCNLMQLTTNKSRTGSARFYRALGFTASHVGYKRDLS